MSTTTILELRQEDAHELIQLPNGTFQNGQYTTTLTHPITLEDGDQVSVKSVYLDTSAGTSGYISWILGEDHTEFAIMDYRQHWYGYVFDFVFTFSLLIPK